MIPGAEEEVVGDLVLLITPAGCGLGAGGGHCCSIDFEVDEGVGTVVVVALRRSSEILS